MNLKLLSDLDVGGPDDLNSNFSRPTEVVEAKNRMFLNSSNWTILKVSLFTHFKAFFDIDHMTSYLTSEAN